MFGGRQPAQHADHVHGTGCSIKVHLRTQIYTSLQVVAGINHILHLETSDDGGRKDVEVTVWEKLPANVKANESPLELTASKLVGGPVAEVSGFPAQPRVSGCFSSMRHPGSRWFQSTA